MGFSDAQFNGKATVQGVVGLLVVDIGDLTAQCAELARGCQRARTRSMLDRLIADTRNAENIH
ncbi:MAG: hypothetical protein ACK40L_01555 [Hydrogenophaga sp.]